MDLGSSEANTVATIGMGVVGAVVGSYSNFGGYQGFQLGLAIGGYLFRDEIKEHPIYNEQSKDTRTLSKLEVVPMVVGTDIVPAQVIWSNSLNIRSVDATSYDNPALNDWLDGSTGLFGSTPEMDLKLFHVEALINLCGYQYFGNKINRIFFDKINIWSWLRFQDWLGYKFDYGVWQGDYEEEDWNPVQFPAHSPYYHNDEILNPSLTLDGPKAGPFDRIFYYWGAMTVPTTQRLLLESFGQISDDYKRPFSMIGGMPPSFPDVKSEITSEHIFYVDRSGYAVLSGGTFNPHTYPVSSCIYYAHWGSAYNYCFRDNESQFTYGMFTSYMYTDSEGTNAPWYGTYCSLRRKNYYVHNTFQKPGWSWLIGDDTKTITKEAIASDDWVYENITHKGYNHSMELSRQDIDGDPNRLYIFLGRTWNHYGTTTHHHAPYSLEYDIFYIDRTGQENCKGHDCAYRQLSSEHPYYGVEPSLDWGTNNDDYVSGSYSYEVITNTEKVVSVCKEKQISIEGEDYGYSGAIPSFKAKSMEIVGDTIFVMGTEASSHSPWSDVRVSEGYELVYYDGKPCTKIYMDLSMYPWDYWFYNEGPLGTGTGGWAYHKDSAADYVTHLHGCNKLRYQILSQTWDYIIVDGRWHDSIQPVTGTWVHLTKVRNEQAGWGIVGYGSTKTKVIVNCPAPFSPVMSTLGNYNAILLPESNDPVSGKVLSGVSGSSVDILIDPPLYTELTNTPIPGELAYFYFVRSNNQSDIDKAAYPDHFGETLQNYWFMDNIEERFCTDWAGRNLMGSDSCVNFYEKNTYYYHGTWLDHISGNVSEGKYGIYLFNKNTGDYIGKYFERTTWGYGGGILHADASSIQVSSVSTDAQVMVTFNILTGEILKSYSHSLLINKTTLEIADEWYGTYSEDNALNSTSKQYRGCVKVRAYDPVTQTYENRWYALCAELTPTVWWTLNHDDRNRGYYLLDLGSIGSFPPVGSTLDPTESQEYSGILNVDANKQQMIKWYRPITGNSGWTTWTNDSHSTRKDSPQLAIAGYDDKLVMGLSTKGYDNYFDPYTFSDWGGQMEPYAWLMTLPNEFDRYGYCFPIAGKDYHPTWCDAMMGHGVKAHYHSPLADYWDQPINNKTFGSGYMSSIYDYNEEIINDKFWWMGKEINVREPRFLYSLVYDKKKSELEWIKDEAVVTNSFIFDRKKELKFLTRWSVPIHHFGYVKATFTVTQSYIDPDIIYADFSDYPDNFWIGDYVIGIPNYFREGSYNLPFQVEEQYEDRIVLSRVYNADEVPVGYEFTIVKDNISFGSFTYAQKPRSRKANKVRIEYINRLLEYKIDIAEADDWYAQDIRDQNIRTLEIKAHAVKRCTHAGRLALSHLDQEQYINWICSFQTSVVGNIFTVGDCISVTHEITDWYMKPFIIRRIERLADGDAILECEEYVAGVYHDYSAPVYVTGGGGSGGLLPYSDTPTAARRAFAYYDPIANQVYVTYANPVDDATFMGVDVQVKLNDGTWQTVGTATTPVASVVYSANPGTSTPSDMEPTRTKFNENNEYDYQYTEIPYDPLTMIGTFPAAGYLWVNGELIYYHGIDTVNYKFINVVRGIEVPEYQYAADAPDDGYNWTNPLIVLADTANAFSFTLTDDMVDLTAESGQTEGSQIEYDLPTVTIRLIAKNIMNMPSYDVQAPEYTVYLRGSYGRPYSVDLLRYERDL
jgi:hypothetical protein